MVQIKFLARGHKNIRGTHKTTIEITRESTLTSRGDCIIGINATLSLRDFSEEAKVLAKRPDTIIRLELVVNNMRENIEGHGDENLLYTDPTCMVVRKSNYTCSRTLMVEADRAAIDLDREFIKALREPTSIIHGTIIFIQ